MKIVIPDKVSKTSKEMFEKERFRVMQEPGIDIKECNKLSKEADAIVVRSYKLHDLDFDDSLKAIGRAGAGVNNIPVDDCTENGIVVFNTPGANANAVKELVICSLLLASRRIIDGVNWTISQKDEAEVHKLVEKNKSKFKGNEIRGKTLGVIGLGAIGMLIANDGVSLGMKVIGYDPYITVENAWKLSSMVKRADDLDYLLNEADYVTVHVPFMDKTKGMINKNLISKMKDNVRIMNFSRGEIANSKDILKAVESGKVSRYVTDFPTKDMVGVENIITVPHLGASTKESEENCAVMVADQLVDFLQHGNIKNSVNFPDCSLERTNGTRVIVINKNIPGVVGHISTMMADNKLNIIEMINKSKGDAAYNIIDVGNHILDEVLKKIEKVEGVVRVRKID